MSTSENRQSFNLAKVSRYTVYEVNITCPGDKYSYFASHETDNSPFKGLPLSSLHHPGPSLNLASPQDISLEQYCISDYFY